MSLAVDNLRVYYRTLKGDVRALDGVTFSVADGEIMGLAGESGCGKTTLGKSLIRLDGRMQHIGATGPASCTPVTGCFPPRRTSTTLCAMHRG